MGLSAFETAIDHKNFEPRIAGHATKKGSSILERMGDDEHYAKLRIFSLLIINAIGFRARPYCRITLGFRDVTIIPNSGSPLME